MKLQNPLRRMPARRRFRPVNIAASVMTIMNLYMGVASIFASIGLEFNKAAIFIFMAIAFDMLDGFVARLTKSVSEFGKELDSLCDIVSFGIAPAVLVFMIYLPEGAQLVLFPKAGSIVGRTGSYMAIIYAICTALRLARYNTFQSDRRDSFIGLPSPAAGGSLAAFVLFVEYIYTEERGQEQLGGLAYAIGPMAVALALLMVSTVRYPRNRFKALVLKPQHAFPALAAVAFVVAVVHYAVTRSVALVLFPLGMAYVLFGLGDTAYAYVTGRKEGPEEELAAGELDVDGPEDYEAEAGGGAEEESPVNTDERL